MFYNQEKKEEFIQDYMRSKVIALTSLNSLFNKTCSYEQKIHKDCCEFTVEDIITMYKSFNVKAVQVLGNYNVILKHYTARQIYLKQATENSYVNVTKEVMFQCVDKNKINNKYLTRSDIVDIENQLLNYTDKAIIEALWNGIGCRSMTEITSLVSNMIDTKLQQVKTDYYTYNVTKELVFYLTQAFQETEYVCYGETMRVKQMQGSGLYKERDNVHAADSEDKFFRWVYRKIQNFRNYVGAPDLTMKTIQASGLLHFLLEIKDGYQYSTLRETLYNEKAKRIALQYGYTEQSYIDVITNKFQEIGY